MQTLASWALIGTSWPMGTEVPPGPWLRHHVAARPGPAVSSAEPSPSPNLQAGSPAWPQRSLVLGPCPPTLSLCLTPVPLTRPVGRWPCPALALSCPQGDARWPGLGLLLAAPSQLVACTLAERPCPATPDSPHGPWSTANHWPSLHPDTKSLESFTWASISFLPLLPSYLTHKTLPNLPPCT